MLLSRVLVGKSTLGTADMIVPPKYLNANGKNIHYDSTRNTSSEIFVCYQDAQCYPEYLISYRSIRY